MYCPFLPPTDPPGSSDCSRWEEYDSENLPICDNNTFRFDATHIEETGDKKAADLTRISGLAILGKLASIDFPRSFPPDGMHLFFENVIPALVRHHRGVFFKKDYIADAVARNASSSYNNQEQAAVSGVSGRRR